MAKKTGATRQWNTLQWKKPGSKQSPYDMIPLTRNSSKDKTIVAESEE